MYTKNKSRVFITGASGFIGANVTRLLLKKNYDVHILNRTPTLSWRLKDIEEFITTHTGDLTDFYSLKRIVKKIYPDYIIHLGTYGAYHYQTELTKIARVNILGTINLLEASKDIAYKCFINTGSSSEYGYKNKPMKEDDFCDPVSFYAATKLSTTQICKIFAHHNNKPIITLRLFSAYGPYEEATRFIPTIVESLIVTKAIKLTLGKIRRDFIYIDDVSHAYLRALKVAWKFHGEIFNIGTGKEYTNDEIVSRLFKLTEKKVPVKKGAYPKRSWDTHHWISDISKSKKKLGWKQDYTIDKGLSATYSWFQKNIHFYKK